MASRSIPLKVKRSFGETLRRDSWWLQPLLVLLGLSAFLVYSNWAAFQNAHYWYSGGGANYLSAILFTGVIWRFGARIVWTKTGWFSVLDTIFTGIFNTLGTRRVSLDLLLLSRCLLQSVLGRSGKLCRWRV